MAEISGSSSGHHPESSSSRNWVILIGEGLKQYEQDHKSGPKPKKVMYQVRKLLRDVNPEHYTPEEFHFGLFNRSPPKELRTRGDKCKLAMVSAVLEVLKRDWLELCKRVVPKPQEIQDHYDDQGRPALSLADIQNVLTLDAVFLASFLGSHFCTSFAESFPSFREAIDPNIASMIMLPLMKDLFKVENQIPLCLIREVLLILVEELVDPESSGTLDSSIDIEEIVNKVLKNICAGAVHNLSHLLPGMDNEDPSAPREANCIEIVRLLSGRATFVPLQGIEFLECKNFIDCMYRMMCQGMAKSSGTGAESSLEASSTWKTLFSVGNWFRVKRFLPKRETAYAPVNASSSHCLEGDKAFESTLKVPLPKVLPVILPNITELQTAGIQFRGFSGCFKDIDFKSGTLYLPILTLSEDNEAFWRNLVAYEDALLHEREKSCHMCCLQEFTHYFEFMDKLIDDANDVMVLKSGRHPIIRAHTLGTDQAVADIFNNRVTQNCSVIPNKKWSDLHYKVYHYYNKDRRRMWLEFKQTYCGKPWLTVSVLVAILLLIATLLQTYYTIFPRVSISLINSSESSTDDIL